MKRQRGRGRKPGGGGHHNYQPHNNQPNRTMESNGPEIKVRGPAAHIYERYLQLARDATSSGDRVLGENYLQHADHYFRLLRAMQPAAPPQPVGGDRFGNENDSDHEGEAEGGEGDSQVGYRDDQPEAEFPTGQPPQPQQQQQQQHMDRDGEFRRRRGRRNRFRPGEPGGEDAGPREPSGSNEGGDRPERAERAERAGRAPREADAPAEGFSHGPKPAFLRTDG